MKATLLVLCALVALSAAGPVRQIERSDTCAKTCKPSQKFRYQPGKTYSYDYTVRTETSVDGASEDKAAISITGQADIEVIDQCDLVLKLKSMNVREIKSGIQNQSPRSSEFRRTLERSPLRFSFQDGIVEELCPDSQEDGWALNVKRGVLSALQNSMDKLEGSQNVRETDVTGRCQAKYEVTDKGWYTTSVKRTKDLLGCSDRSGYSGSLQTSQYNVASELQSVPLMKSEHECQQEVSNQGILQTSTCTEQHLFRPFSAENSGAVTKVAQVLKFNSERHGIRSRKDSIHSRAEMPFDHSYGISDSSEARARAESLLIQLCDVTLNGIRPEVPRLFSQLVGAVQKMDQGDIKDIYSQLKRQAICSNNNQRTKKFFLDALPMAGTSEAVSMMAKLMIDEDVSGVELDLWLASLAFISDPSNDMLRAVKTLVDFDKLKEKAMLPVSAMVNNYCKSRPGCSSEFEVESIMASLERNIGYSCYVTDSNIKTTLLALKALGNTGQDRAASVVNRCLAFRLPVEVKVEAAKAYRRMPCDTDKSKLTDIIQDTKEDVEVRIAAYTQLMICPSKSLLDQLQIVMESEPEDSQLGSFMYTHLTNLMETSSPHKQDVRQMLKDLKLQKEFQLNPLKFSRNYEKSLFVKMFNTGAQGESNVIFSPQSPLPRSVSANLTFDLFGHSVNLFEVGGRLEGIEYLLETVLGPYSFFGDGKNSAKDKLEELKGSIYARIFGNEMAYNRFQGMKSLTSGKTFNLLDFLIKLSKDHDYTFTQSMQFLDSSITVPTASGLPLTLAVNATASVDVRANGKMDLRKVQTSPRSIYVDGELRPSGAVNVDGVMSVDALVARTGLKVSGSLHSSMALKGRVDLDRGRVLSVQLDMPDDRQDILDIRTQFFILSTDEEKEQKMITENRKELELCTGDMLAQVTGLEVCGQLQFPNASMKASGPYFPLTGPASLSFILHKRDSHTGYKLLAKRVENKRSSIAQLSFDTPGSSVVRAVSFDMMIDYNKKEAEISFASPWKKSALTGSLVNEDGLKSMTGSLVVDDKETYAVTSEVKIEDKNKVVIYSPVLELRRKGVETVSLKGNIEVDDKFRKLSTDMTLIGLTAHPAQLQATYTNTKAEKSVKSTLTYGKQVYSAQAGVNLDIRDGKKLFVQVEPVLVVTAPRGQLVNVAGTTTYREDKNLKADLTVDIPDLLDKPISLKTGFNKRETKKGPRIDMDLTLKSKPVTTKVKGTVVQRSKVLKQARLIIDYNVLRVRDRIDVSGKFSDKSTSAYRKYTLTSNVDFKRNPDWNVQFGLDVDHKKKRSEGELTLKLGKNRKDKSKHVILSGSVNRKIVSWSEMDVDLKMKAYAPMLDIDTLVSGSFSNTPKSVESKISVTVDKDKSVVADFSIRDKSDSEMKILVDAGLIVPAHKFKLDSSLMEKKPKQYVHTLMLKDDDEQLASLTTNYKLSKDKSHDASTVIVISGLEPIKASGSASLDLPNLQADGQVTIGENAYGLKAMSKLSKGTRGKWTLEAYHPSRKIAFNANGDLRKASVAVDLDFAWDKGRDDKAKVTVEVSGSHKQSKGVTSTNGKVELTSPFKTLDFFSASASYDDDNKRYGLDAKVTVGDKENTISSLLNVVKPVSPRELHATWTGQSPFRGFQRMKASLDHSVDDNSISCSLTASKGRTNCELTLTGRDNGYRDKTDLQGDLKLKSNIDGIEDVGVSVLHKDDGRRYQTQASYERNGQKYSGDLDMNHVRRDWQVTNNGQLKVTIPCHDITTRWQHRNTDSDIKSSLTSNWGNQQLKVSLNGDHNLRGDKRLLNGALTISSPWRTVRDLAFNLQHEAGDRSCKHTAEITHNRKKIASTGLSYNLDDKKADLDFSLTSPFHQDLSGKINSQFVDYPETAHVEFTWAPSRTVTADATVIMADDDGIEGNFRLTTPFPSLRSVVVAGSMAREGEELISKASVDYGVRQNFDIETRIRLDTLSLARVKINTPCEEYRTLDAGYIFSGDQYDFSANADFALKPVLGKYSGVFTLETDPDISAKLRLTTPHTNLQYVQLTATSQETTRGRQSRVELDYYPRQIYSVQSLYSLDMPVVFSVHVETPITGYDSFAASMSHQITDSSVLTHGLIKYLPDQTIESTLNFKWAPEIDGSLVVKTPFGMFEENKLTVRHEGDLQDFNSHAQLDIGEKSMSADARFNSGYTTAGTVTVVSPWKKIETSFNKKGDLDNFRSGAYLTYGDQKIEGSLNHKFNGRVLKTKAKLSTPFTEDIEAAVEYGNRNGDIKTEVSGSYGPKYSIQSESSLLLTLPDIMADSSLTYKLDDHPKVIKAAVSKKGPLNDMELTASASSPYTEDARITVKHLHRLPYTVENTISGNYGQRYSIVSDGKYVFRNPDLTGSYSLKYTLDAPEQEISITGNKRGNFNNLNVDITASTPFEGFERMSTVVAYSGSYDAFTAEGTVEYMTGKKIQQRITFSHDGLRQIQLDASLTTPIPNFERSVVKVNHHKDDYDKLCTGSVQISSSLLGNHEVTYKKTGDLSGMTGEIVAVSSGKKMEGSITRLPLTNGYKHAIALKGLDNKLDASAEYELTHERVSGKASTSVASSSLSVEGDASISGRRAGISGTMTVSSPQLRRGKTVSVSLSKDGDLSSFEMDARGTYDNQEATAHVEYKMQDDDLSGKVTLTTPFQDFRNIGGSFSHKGDLDTFASDGKVTYKDGKEIGGKINFYRYQWRRIEVSTELTTPFPGFKSSKANYRHEGSSDSFSCSASVENEGKKISGDLRASISPKYDASLTVKTPFRDLPSLVVETTLESLANTHSLSSSVDMGSGSRYTVSGNLDMDSIPMTASGQLTTPHESLRRVEISGSHQGQIDDFTSNIVFNTPQTDTIRGDMAVKYNSPLDLSASAAVKSEIGGMEDLLLEVRNSESGDTKHSKLTVRWAPDQQVTADGSLMQKDYWYNKQIQADLSVTTPLEKLRSANVRVEHSDAQNKYSPKVEVSVNGETKLDLDAEYSHGDNPAASVTARKPWPMQATASLTNNGDSVDGEVYVNWNRNEANKNVRVQTKQVHIKDDYQRNIDYSVKVIHASRTASGGFSLLAQQSKLTSEGHVAWDEREQSKIFYQLELTDGSQYRRKNYEGSVTLGVPSRTLEAKGAVTAYRQTSTVDGSFLWDAQRDRTKEVGFTAKVISGEKKKADVTFRLPAIDKEVRIDSEMTMNEDRTVWDGKTALSYSPDSRKTITVSSSLKDVSDSYYNEGKNYSLSLAISHPYTDVDVSLTSHLGAVGDRLSTAMDVEYLTARRQKKSMALRGEIDRLRREINLQLVSPMKSMNLKGKVKSTEPYILALSNEDAVLSEINIDPARRTVLLQSNYDMDYPDNKLVLKMNYVNDSAVRAELYRDQPYQTVSDSLLAARLNTSRLLHTRLAWRPDMLTDLQTFARRKTYQMASSAKVSLQDMIKAVGQEVIAKYTAIADEVSSELGPMVDLLDGELARLAGQLDAIRREVKRMYKQNQFYLQDMGESVEDGVEKLREILSEMSSDYKESYAALVSSIEEKLQGIRSYPIQEKYQESVAELLILAEDLIDRGLISLSHGIAQFDDYLWDITEGVQHQWEDIKNHPQVQRVRQRVELLGHDYQWLMSHLGERVRKLKVPEQYTSAIYNAREAINSGLSGMTEREEVQKFMSAANEVYQQGVWAYKYWKVEENMQKNLASIMQLLKKLIEQELEFLTEKFDFIRKSRVTVYDPEQGEVQAEIVLPVPLESLSEMPDIQSYIDEAKDTVDDYLPSRDTVVDLYNKYAPTSLWRSNDTKQAKEDIMSQFQEYQPQRRTRDRSTLTRKSRAGVYRA